MENELFFGNIFTFPLEFYIYFDFVGFLTLLLESIPSFCQLPYWTMHSKE